MGSAKDLDTAKSEFKTCHLLVNAPSSGWTVTYHRTRRWPASNRQSNTLPCDFAGQNHV